MKSFRRRKLIEKSAREELSKENGPTLEDACNIISDGLSCSDLVITREMFIKGYNNLFFGKSDQVSSFILGSVQKTLKDELIVPSRSVDAYMQTNESEIHYRDKPQYNIPAEVSSLNNVPLDEVLSSVIDGMASYLFTRGVFLDLDVEDNLWVKASREGLEQMTFQLISYLSQEVQGSAHSKRISIKAKRDGSNVCISIFAQNQVFSAGFLEKINSSFVMDHSGLQIVKELTCECGAKLEFINQASESGDDFYGVVNLNFESGSKEKHLVGIKKGKKKDLMKDMTN